MPRCPLRVAVTVLMAAWSIVIAADARGDSIITTVAGNGQPENNGDRGPATEMAVGDPFGVEIGPDGALYITEVRNHRVRRLDLSSGQLTTVAGFGEKGYAGDGGPATGALLNEPYEVRFDGAGNMFFVEMQNHVVRKVEAATGVISTVAGNGQAGFSGDGGPAVKAMLRQPHSIALDDKQGLYIADIGNHRIRRVDLNTGLIESIAGSDERKLPIDGQLARGNPMLGPRALYFQEGQLWIALREGHSVWRLDLASGRLAHVAGKGQRGYAGDGRSAKEALFDGPKGIAIGPRGEVVVVDTENHALRVIDSSSGAITTLAGLGPERGGYVGDGGPAAEARLDRPHGVCVGRDGAVYVGDTLNHRVRRIGKAPSQ